MVEDRNQKGAHARVKQPDLKKVSTQEEQAQTKFRPSPYQPPCPVPPPAGAPPGVEPDHTELIQRILEQHETFRQILVQLTEISKSIETAPEPENRYYNTPQTVIQAVTPTQPNSPDIITILPSVATWTALTAYSVDTLVKPTTATGFAYNCTTAGTSGAAEPAWPTTLGTTVADGTVVWTCISAAGYQVEGIYTQLERISPRVTVINDGTTTLYAITTSDGSNWSQESPILIGEARTLFNVWELRLRSPAAGSLTPNPTGGVYRVTEYDFWLAYSSAIAAASLNRAAFTARSVPINNLPATTQLPNITVPNGFALAVRATVGNATVIYLANSAANLVNPANRITLNAGDTASLTITNANLVFVAGLAGLGVNNVDILVEQ